MKTERTGEYVSPMIESFVIGFEGLLCVSTMENTSLESYFGLGDNQQDIF